jgi:hypothetical protein
MMPVLAAAAQASRKIKKVIVGPWLKSAGRVERKPSGLHVSNDSSKRA